MYITFHSHYNIYLLNDLKGATLRPETTPDKSGHTETIATSGSCVAQRQAGHNTGLSHVGARVSYVRHIEAWRNPGYHISPDLF